MFTRQVCVHACYWLGCYWVSTSHFIFQSAVGGWLLAFCYYENEAKSVFPCVQISPGSSLVCVSSSVFPGFSWLWTTWGSIDQIFLKKVLHCRLVFSYWLKLGCGFWGRIPQKRSSHHITSRAHTISMTYQWWRPLPHATMQKEMTKHGSPSRC